MAGNLLIAISAVALFSLSAKPVMAQFEQQGAEWEFNLEGGLDVRPAYELAEPLTEPYVLVESASQRVLAPFVGLSAMRRITGLRALFGVRIDAHAAELTAVENNYLGNAQSATAMLTYRAFFLDLQGDCDCPTWGNDPWLKKALFFEGGVGGSYRQLSSDQQGVEDRSSLGGAYLLRLGVSHRFTRAMDVYAAAGLHGMILENGAFGKHDYAFRPTLGITYRPGR